MGVFSRIRDIVNSNINGALDQRENPEKMIDYIIREMEDALVNLKASCARVMADRHGLQRTRDNALGQCRSWEKRAQRSIDLGREDLAREALLEKRRYLSEMDSLEKEIGRLDGLELEYRNEMNQIAARLTSARDKKRVLVQRHIQAGVRKRSQENIRRYETSDVLLRFEQFAGRLDRKDPQGDILYYEPGMELEDEFDRLEDEEWIERNLAALKASLN